MTLTKNDKQFVVKLEKLLKIHFKNKQLLICAFTHSSYAHENKTTSNERLEFLGDSVLGLVISERLFGDEKLSQEGRLSQLRSQIVSEEPLAKFCVQKGLNLYLRVGVGEAKSNPSRAMIADLVEAVIGAVYLDQGFKVAKRFILLNFEDLVREIEQKKQTRDSKSYLQEKCCKLGVRYHTTGMGEAHSPWFKSIVFVGNRQCGRGEGKSKREAEKQAAQNAIELLESKEIAEKQKRKNKNKKLEGKQN